MNISDFLKEKIIDESFKKEYENITIPLDDTWAFLKDFEFTEICLSEILNKVDYYRETSIIYPPRNQVLDAFNKTPFDKVRVVIIGQDPYHEPNQANGLAFSVNRRTPLPPSLKNIFKELKNDLGGVLERANGDLSDWAEQGVLLLNTALTVEIHKPNGMKALWSDFTDKVIKVLGNSKKPLIFVLWGAEAQKKEKYIKKDLHYIIKSAHPSPLSAYRGFFGSKPFSKINDKLIEWGEKPIEWEEPIF